MLLIQHIRLHWQKECRGAPYSTYRNEMPKALILPENFSELKSGFYLNLKQKNQARDNNLTSYPIHDISLQQNKEGINEKINRVVMHNETEAIRIGAIEGIRQDDNYQIRYKYDYHRAIPERIFYDPKLNGYRSVDETAMCLALGDYGRVIYNGRLIECDTGTWYYEMHIINLIHIIDNNMKADIFCVKEPDIIYSQIAYLI